MIFLLPLTSFSQGKRQKVPEKTRVLFLLDASGSMLAKWENGIRMEVAKKMLSELVDSLKVNPNIEIGLRIYGHQFHKDKQNCQDTKLEIPFSKGNHAAIIKRLSVVKPLGTTPIALSLEKAANDFPVDTEARNVLILITDGIESCGGDPCAISLALQTRNVFLKPYVIGLGMDKKYEEQFGCVGQFFDAYDEKTFKKALTQVLKQSMAETSVAVELLNQEGQRTEKDVNVTFINNFTGFPVYDFVHYRYANGQPDSVTIDPVLTYDLMVNTIPPVYKRKVPIELGKHNVIEVKAPQGNLEVSMVNYTEYRKGLNVLVKDIKTGETINLQTVPASVKYLVGKYDVEVHCIPRKVFKDVIIEQGKVTKLTLEAPGLVNFNSTIPGVASLYTISETGQQEWLMNLGEKDKVQNLAMQPGNYKVVFRASKAMGSKFTEVTKFTVKSGATLNIKLF